MTISSAFLNLVNISITASWLVLAIVIFRLVFKKAPKYITCALWALVAIRLIFPISIESPVSLIPSEETIPLEIEYTKNPTVDTGFNSLDTALNPVIQENFTPSDEITSMNPTQLPIYLGAYIWQMGVLGMLLYALFSYIRIRFKVRERVKIDTNIYICDRIPSPFILGLIRPKIYLPSHLNEEESQFVISHEKAHLKRLDFIWKPLGYILLTIYWFNPVMWLGYILLCRDIEYACDEKVVKEMTLTEKKDYSETLLSLSIHRPYVTACPLAFGESGVKGRIKSVLSYKKPAFWVILVALILSITLAICFLTNPMVKSFKTNSATPFATYHDGRMYFVDISRIYSCDKNFEDVEFLTEGFALYPCVLGDTLYFIGESYEHTTAVEAINLKTNEHKEIYVSQVDGTITINYLSPFGDNLLFHESGDIVIIDTNGNEISRVSPVQPTAIYSDEECFIYTKNFTLNELHKYDFKTQEDNLLLTLDEGTFGWTFYPDGKYIYFTLEKGDTLSFCRFDTKSGEIETLLEEGFGWEFVIDKDMCYFIKGTHQSDDENLYAFNIKSRKLTTLPCPAAQYATGLQLFGDYLVVNTHYFIEPDLALLNLRDNSFKWIGQDFDQEAAKEPIVPQYIKGEIYDILNSNLSFTISGSDTPLTLTTFSPLNNSLPEEYAITDLDNDGTDEIIVRYSTGGDTYIIHKETSGNWVAYYIPFRGSTHIKTDGTMHWSSGASINGVSRVKFTPNGMEIEILIDMNVMDNEYSVNGVSVTREEAQKAYDEFFQKPEVDFIHMKSGKSLYFDIDYDGIEEFITVGDVPIYSSNPLRISVYEEDNLEYEGVLHIDRTDFCFEVSDETLRLKVEDTPNLTSYFDIFLSGDEVVLIENFYLIEGDFTNHRHYIAPSEYKDGLKDSSLKEYYKEDISDVMTLTEAKQITIKYFDYDFNRDDLTDKFVIVASPLHSGSAGDSIDILLNNGDGTYKDICGTHLRLPENPDIFVVPQMENYPNITIITDKVRTFTFNGKAYTIPSKETEDKLFNLAVETENRIEQIINDEDFIITETTYLTGHPPMAPAENLTFASLCEQVEDYCHGNAVDIFLRKNHCNVFPSGTIIMNLLDVEITYSEYDRDDFTLLTEGDLSTALFKRYYDKSDPTTCREYLYLFTPNASGKHIINDILIQRDGEWVRVEGVW